MYSLAIVSGNKQSCLSCQQVQQRVTPTILQTDKRRQSVKVYLTAEVTQTTVQRQKTQKIQRKEETHQDVVEETSTPWWERDQQPNMMDANSVQELVDILAVSGDKLVIVDFFATWCNACRALYPKLVKMCKENEDNILLVKVNWQENKDICKPLGIKVLPYFQFYRGAQGRVAAFSASITKIQRLKDAISEHGSPRCQLTALQEPILAEFPDVHPAQGVEMSGNVVSFSTEEDQDSESSEESSMALV
eukprot:TRINITY_DN3916_c0_g1_i4.p1 TRINITY_DN3916_c0_g1~~TRINITY_DN3916_c0_g1_i4.p1  ORF type:complete len:248 (-),score=17.24 TRINITY_DN3916_c0_g1_i4:440-1183(-)